jgi:3-isopropylmalate dehydrogenase
MLSYSFGLQEEAAAVEAAIEAVLRSGRVTADLRPSGVPATTEQVGESVCAAIG